MKKYQKIILPIVIAAVIAGIAGFSIISQRHTDSHSKSGSPTEQSQEPTQPEKKNLQLKFRMKNKTVKPAVRSNKHAGKTIEEPDVPSE